MVTMVTAWDVCNFNRLMKVKTHNDLLRLNTQGPQAVLAE